ncbi:hypothetical protein N7508_007539 [Penicillium antarcticum]|uniref:uncharacterized protein n=1 Tax=Penicillium antarcticum TaxID=416450 RepID=UPI0023A54200|nr:uncharacterized protein N7508_011220 [Penicillium antarcticum]XP_058318005.1 uncharacterized protein N7508_007539 [Penicillium antarcticum]KAJ5288445.1 hypothetical protein N7508_011220 [Penicillium antarcticum]KAJ5300296.1 hypothetical protein N7508_007539 [Penicillium antarcticum]
MAAHLNMNDTRPDQAQQIVTLVDYAIKLQDKNEKEVESMSKLRDEVRELQEQLHHANITIQCQRENHLYEREAWMAFSRRNCCDRHSATFSKFFKTQLQV